MTCILQITKNDGLTSTVRWLLALPTPHVMFFLLLTVVATALTANGGILGSENDI